MDIKVNQLGQVAQTTETTQTQPTDGSFKFTLASTIAESELQETINTLMNDISVQGELLAKHMDIRYMKKYRQLIKDFLNEVVYRSHEFSRENFLDRRGRHRVYGLVKLVDENLDAIAQELMKDEADHIMILDRIGEIEGLLLDIIT